MSDPETEKCPQIATKETKVPSRHYFSPDANSYMNILPSSHVYKELSCLENTGVFTRQRHGGTHYCVSLKQGLVTVRSNPSAAHCQIPSVSHQPITKSIRSLSPSHCVLTRVQGAVTSFMSWSLLTGRTRIKSEKRLRMFSCSGYSSTTYLGKGSSTLEDIILHLHTSSERKYPKPPEFSPCQ